MQLKTEVNTYLSLKDDYGKIRNEQILIIGKSGHGKGLALEGLAERFKKYGKFLVIAIADPKLECEFAYQMFEPIEKYHLGHLRKIGVHPSKQKIKLYHPYTFNIPPLHLPPINLYTISLKEIGRPEWSLIAETAYDTETMRILLQASQNISREDGIYGIMHYIQNAVRGKRKGKERKYNPKNFYLEASSGTMKAVTEISNYLQPFKLDYFLTKDKCPLKLDWKSILTDQENTHVFLTSFIKDEKLRDFTVLYLLNGILKNKRYLKHPVLIIIDEIRTLCPFKPLGHKFFLSSAIKDALSMMRASGRGMSSILASTVWSDISEEVRNSATTTLFGAIGGGGDMEKIAKAFNYKREIRDQLKSPDYPNSYLIVGKEDMGSITIFFSSSRHAEPHYSFFEMYKREKPLEVKKYDDINEMMKKIYDNEVERFKNKVKKLEMEEKEDKIKKESEKEYSKKEETKVKKVKSKLEKIKEETKQERIKRVLDCKEKNPEWSWRKIGKECLINYKTAQKYYSIGSEEKDKEDEEYSEENVLMENSEVPDVPLFGEEFKLPEE